jgi:hypothetical protein
MAKKRKNPPRRKGGGDGRSRSEPPKSGRFPKGVSGNVTGRPKGSKNLATIFKQAANHPVQATINGNVRNISTAQATIFQLAANAARGDHRATSKFLDYLDEFEKRAAASRTAQYPLSTADMEVLHAIYQRMKQCEPDTD